MLKNRLSAIPAAKKWRRSLTVTKIRLKIQVSRRRTAICALEMTRVLPSLSVNCVVLEEEAFMAMYLT
ncbi:MAG: hypothetical protein AAAB36_24905, partial [Ensifer adhaerens]